MRNCVFSLLVLMGASFALADDSPEAVHANDKRSEIVEPKRESIRQVRRRFTMAQPRGLTLSEPGAYEGELLFAPLNGTSSYALDAEGKVLRSWESEKQPGMSVYADEDGYIVRAAKVNPATGSPFERAGGPGGLLERYSPSGERVWRFGYRDDDGHLHHDFTLMPNGNVLAIAWAKVSSEEALAKGRRPEGVFGKWLYYTRLVEIEPSYPEGGEIVWVWNAWDYLVQDSDPAKPGYGAVADNAHLIDINYYRSPLRSSNAPAGEVQSGAKRKTSRIGEVDWMHANSVDYDPGTGLILVSIHGFDEVWVIDKHAPEKGLVARFGNPRAHGAGGEADQIFFRQHDANWIDEGLPGEGNILLFNNGLPTKDNESASKVMEFKLNRSVGEVELVWEFDGDTQDTLFYAMRMSGAQRLPNGNTLVCHGPKGRVFQVTPNGEVVWEYWNEFGREGPESSNPRHANSVMPLFKARMYAPGTF